MYVRLYPSWYNKNESDNNKMLITVARNDSKLISGSRDYELQLHFFLNISFVKHVLILIAW